MKYFVAIKFLNLWVCTLFDLLQLCCRRLWHCSRLPVCLLLSSVMDVLWSNGAR